MTNHNHKLIPISKIVIGLMMLSCLIFGATKASAIQIPDSLDGINKQIDISSKELTAVGQTTESRRDEIANDIVDLQIAREQKYLGNRPAEIARLTKLKNEGLPMYKEGDSFGSLQNLFSKLNPRMSSDEHRALAGERQSLAASANINRAIALRVNPEYLKGFVNHRASKDKATPYPKGEEGIPEICGKTEIGCQVMWGITFAIHNFIVPLFAKILSLVNILFNQVFDFSVRHFSDYVKGPIENGWKTARDLVNLSLIFILIYAALGLILKADNNQKKVVTKVIVVALLVNFSAMLTGIVIDASNIAANQFYTMSSQGAKTIGNAPDITAPMIKMSTSQVTMSSLKAQFEAGTLSKTGLLAFIAIQDMLKIPFFLITAIVLGAGALMFFVRMIVLIFLIMLAPLAMLAWTLPSTQKYFNKWMGSLINNCIFAPAFFFLFAISVLTVSKGYLNNMASTGGGDDFTFVGNLIYAIMINGLMVASLLVAKEFGAYGASGALGALNKGQKGARSWAGRQARTRIPYLNTNRAGQLAEWSQRSNSLAARTLRTIPGFNRAAGRTGAFARADIASTQRTIDSMNLSDNALRARASQITTSRTERAAISNILASRNSLEPRNGLNQGQIQQAATIQSRIEARSQARPIQVVAWQHSPDPIDRARAITGQPANDAAGMPLPGGRVAPIAPATVTQLGLNDYFDRPVGTPDHDPAAYARNQAVREAMYQNFRQSHVDQIQSRSDDAADRFIRNLRQDFVSSPMGVAYGVGPNPTIGSLIQWLRAPSDPAIEPDPNERGMNNPQLATWANSPLGQNMLRNYGFI